MERFYCYLAGFAIALALVGIFTLVKSWWEQEYETLVSRVKVETTIMVYEQVKNAEERIVSRLAEKGGSMRPIDADALLQRWNNLLPRMARDKDGAVPIDFCLAIREVSATPTLTLDDLRPKGRWITQDETFTAFQCSRCECKNFRQRWNYCPACGADMQGGGEDD